jgi:ATP-dependent phosphofructokinase / diphosphate-dependent phosphofructokinase
MARLKRIGVLTGGGDAPGLNAVIRAVVKAGVNNGIEVVGLEDSFDGLIEPNRSRVMTAKDVTGILRRGGTVLGTVNRGDPFTYQVETSEGKHDYSTRVVEMFHRMGLDALVVIGGDGTLAIAHKFSRLGIPLVGVPKTIDNDIVKTTNTFGFDTAVAFATDAIDRLHTTAEAHRRILVVEVMGRYTGWIALYAGLGGGADVILIPEIPYDLKLVAQQIQDRDAWGAHFSIVVVAEGSKPVGGATSLIKAASVGRAERLGGAGHRIAAELEEMTGKETRTVVLGHLQRGGSPTAFDRVLATRFGGKAVELLKRGETDRMVAFHPPDITSVPLEDVVGKTKTVPTTGFDVVETARAIGVSFGD